MGVPGFEPGTSSLSEKRSNQLSYAPLFSNLQIYDNIKYKRSSRSEFEKFQQEISFYPLLNGETASQPAGERSS